MHDATMLVPATAAMIWTSNPFRVREWLAPMAMATDITPESMVSGIVKG